MRLFVGKVFHWQSPSTTSDNSPTEQRYVHHREKGTLFCCLCGKIRQTVSAKARGVYTFGERKLYTARRFTNKSNCCRYLNTIRLKNKGRAESARPLSHNMESFSESIPPCALARQIQRNEFLYFEGSCIAQSRQFSTKLFTCTQREKPFGNKTATRKICINARMCRTAARSGRCLPTCKTKADRSPFSRCPSP